MIDENLGKNNPGKNNESKNPRKISYTNNPGKNPGTNPVKVIQVKIQIQIIQVKII